MNKKYQKHAYKTLLNILDKCYTETKSDALGTLLGSMNPELFCDSDSADPATFEDFCDCLNDCYRQTHAVNI